MSVLSGIIKRLNDLKETAVEGQEPSQRFFEVNGNRVCSVKYFHKTEMYELEVYGEGKNTDTYQFDNIDMIAIEIFDLIS